MNVAKQALKLLMNNRKNTIQRNNKVLILLDQENFKRHIRYYFSKLLGENPNLKCKFTKDVITIYNLGDIILQTDYKNIDVLAGVNRSIPIVYVHGADIDELFEIKRPKQAIMDPIKNKPEEKVNFYES